MPSAVDVFSWSLVLVLVSTSATTKRLFDLESHLAFYSGYHRNAVNRVIHLACIWPLLASVLVICDASTPLAPTPTLLAPLLRMNAGAVIAAIFCAYYIALDRSAYGLASASAVLVSYALARAWTAAASQPVFTAACVHGMGWLAQFAGHALFEKRAPALFENFAQALLMAPHFVLVEACVALGFRAQLAASIEPLVARRVRGFTAAGTR